MSTISGGSLARHRLVRVLGDLGARDIARALPDRASAFGPRRDHNRRVLGNRDRLGAFSGARLGLGLGRLARLGELPALQRVDDLILHLAGVLLECIARGLEVVLVQLAGAVRAARAVAHGPPAEGAEGPGRS
eukprot:CAMPEP_0195059240 /NCGR_PEP_ID=MMETSP0448-20130528/6774_1 /TAXON_ID=66468 /ORGANISM="Heterocapsa triquestra, Strain CCMP 448" /LENGTH=132 /DNA_ID=CAMNT_0040089469 /DNA_START=143 /DNA_END=538 /DNA_ORIENTATION=+